jgi:glycosyltransferase involved in cell wall biosynthesis
VEGRVVLLTFGLLSPNKGIEHVLNALPRILAEFPEVVYIVLGATHPNELREHGEAYRLSLEILARKNKVEKNVIFYNQFVDLENLKEFIGAADLYITPYLNEAQITSGTLPTRLAPAKRWFRRLTGTPRNCWRKIAACWCRSAMHRPSHAR